MTFVSLNVFILFYLVIFFVTPATVTGISSPVKHNTRQQTNTAVTSNKYVFVCITGQIARLELQNKIDKLFLPLYDRGYTLYIGLALTTRKTANFVNNDNGDKMQLFKSIDEVLTTLMNVRGVAAVRHFDKVNNVIHVPYNEVYQHSLAFKPGVDNVTRAKLNAHQLKVLQYCNQWPKVSNSSSFFVRMREDTLISHIDLDPIIKQAERGAVVTTACDAWRGINDKIAFGPSSRAKEFFLLPFKFYLTLSKVVQSFNPEQLYRKVYSEHKFKLIASHQYVVTKAVVKELKQNGPTKEAKAAAQSVMSNYNQPFAEESVMLEKKMCEIKGNPFKPYSANCPINGVSEDVSYRAVCYPY